MHLTAVVSTPRNLGALNSLQWNRVIQKSALVHIADKRHYYCLCFLLLKLAQMHHALQLVLSVSQECIPTNNSCMKEGTKTDIRTPRSGSLNVRTAGSWSCLPFPFSKRILGKSRSQISTRPQCSASLPYNICTETILYTAPCLFCGHVQLLNWGIHVFNVTEYNKLPVLPYQETASGSHIRNVSPCFTRRILSCLILLT